MPKYDISFSYNIREFGDLENVPANNPEDAKELALEDVRELYPDITDITIDEIKEVI